MAAEMFFQGFDARRVAGVAFAGGGEHVGDFFIAVDVEEHIHAVFFHLLLDEQDFGAEFLAGALPGAVEVLAHGVGAQVAMEGAVRVHVRNQIQIGDGQQFFQFVVAVLLQALNHALHKPFGHVFAGVLLGDDPHLAPALDSFASAQQLNIAAFSALAGGQQGDPGVLQGLLDQPVMAFTAVGFEVGKPGVLLPGLEGDVQDLAIKARRYPEPVDMVVGRHGVVTAPGIFVRRAPCVAQAKGMGVPHVHAFGLEVEPLVVIAAGVGFDCQQQLISVAGIQDLDVAAVEVGADLDGGQGHGHSLVA